MIRFLKRSQINEEKYNHCIANSLQSRIYVFSWYLDIVADNWSVLVLDDYKAVMPLPYRKKHFIKYVYPPFWLLELGVFSLSENAPINEFVKVLFKKFRFVESRLNTHNVLYDFTKYTIKKQFQVLDLNEEYNTLLSNYKKDRKKDLNKAAKANLISKWNDNPTALITLFKNNVGQRTPQIKESDYHNLQTLMLACISNNVGELLSVYDANNQLVASGFFLMHKKKVTLLVSSTDFTNRNNGANTFLIDCAIKKYQSNFTIFNFGGSTMQSIASYFKSFGAITETYFLLKKRLL